MGSRPSLLQRLTASAHHLDAAQLRDEVERASCTAISDARRGQEVTVLGRLRGVVYTPAEHVPTLAADLFDGTDVIRLIWLGRRRIVGIEPGRRIRATGRIGVYEGRPAIYNPRYELIPPPGEGQ